MREDVADVRYTAEGVRKELQEVYEFLQVSQTEHTEALQRMLVSMATPQKCEPRSLTTEHVKCVGVRAGDVTNNCN